MSTETGRVRNPAGTKRAVLDAAERLFAQRGLDGVSMRDIGDASGVSQPLIHHHFGSKEELYQAVLHRSADDYASQFSDVISVTDQPVDLRAEMTRLFEFLRQNEAVRRIVGWCRLEGKEDSLSSCREFRQAMHQRIERAQRLGIVRDDIDAVTLGIMLEALIIHWLENRALNAFLFEGSPDDEAYLQKAISVVEQGFAPRNASSHQTGTRATMPADDA